MARKHKATKLRQTPKAVLKLPDLDQAKSAVLNSLSSTDAQRGYRHAMDEFIEWYCSEPRLSFNREMVLRYRMPLESRYIAPGTVNLRLGVVRRLTYEAADCGLLSPELAAGIRRVKGVKKLGVRLGNWLTVEQATTLWQSPSEDRLKGKRDRALGRIACVWTSAAGGGIPGGTPRFAPERSLGDHRYPWQGCSRSNRASARLGQSAIGSFDASGGDPHRKDLSTFGEGRNSLGNWDVREGGVARSPRVRHHCRHRDAGASRSPASLRPALSFGGRRIRANSVLARPRLHPNDGALPGLQATNQGCRERSSGNRATGLRSRALTLRIGDDADTNGSDR